MSEWLRQALVFEMFKAAMAFGTILSFTLGFGVFILRRRTWNETFVSFMLLGACASIVVVYADMIGVPQFIGALTYIFLPVLYVGGPGMYLFYHASFDSEYQMPSVRWLHFAPAGVLALVLASFWWAGAPEMSAPPLDYFRTGEMSWLHICWMLVIASNLGYRAALMFQTRDLDTNDASLTQLSRRLLLSGYFTVSTVDVVFLIAILTRSLDTMIIQAAALSFYLNSALFFRFRFPEYFGEAVRALKREGAGYKKSRLSEVDLKATHLRLVELMNNDKLYLDEELSVSEVAKRLELKPYQLSEFMNRYLKVSFPSFVNGFRIEKAKQILAAEHDADMTSVAFKVGFSSKGTFQKAFNKGVGMAPSEFARKNGG